MEKIKGQAFVIGSPVSHSLSPFIFKFIAHEEGCVLDYQSFEVKEVDGKNFLQKALSEEKVLGCNVTIPLKETFLNDIHFKSPEVSALGALNVLYFQEKKVCGYNTDIIGIQKTLEGKNFDVNQKKCLLLGAGGSAKAVAYVLGKEKASDVFIYNRSERNKELVEKFQNLFPETKWHAANSFEVASRIDLVINTIPLGMTGKESGADFFKSLQGISFNSNALAFDLIYTPEHTDFLETARKLGLETVNGLGMLIDQALATWEIWIGELKDENSLHKKLVDFLNGILELRENPAPVFLTGFMGVGKSTVGAELAMLSGRQFVDTDKLIETKAGMSTPEIFKNQNEDYFRRLEHEVVVEVSASGKNSIISLGGGALMNEESFNAIKKNGMAIYLSASEKTLNERIIPEDRPKLANLTVDERVKKISELLSLRKNTYEKANIEIKTDDLSATAVVFNIVSAIGKKERGGK